MQSMRVEGTNLVEVPDTSLDGAQTLFVSQDINKGKVFI